MRRRLALAVCFFVGASAVSRQVHAADPTVGDCLEATETSLTLRMKHKLHAAREQLVVCTATTCPASIREECAHRMAELNAAEPTVVFLARTETGQELSAVTVTMDGASIADHLDGSALALDPGSHEFRFGTAGRPVVTQTLILHEGEKNRREPITFSASAPRSAEIEASQAPQAPVTGHGRRVAGVVTGATGLAAIVVGSVFGGLTFAAWGDATTACPSRVGCSSGAMNDRSRTTTYGTVSDIGFIAGGVLLAGGLTLYLTAPKNLASAARVGLLPGGLRLTLPFQ